MARDRSRWAGHGTAFGGGDGVDHGSVFQGQMPGGAALSVTQGILKGLREGVLPPPDARPAIEAALLDAGDPEVIVAYASAVIGGSWPAAEGVIAAGPADYAMPYWKEALDCDPWPDLERSMTAQVGQDGNLAPLSSYLAVRTERSDAMLAAIRDVLRDSPGPRMVPTWRRVDLLSMVSAALAGGLWPDGDALMLDLVSSALDTDGEGAVESASHHALITRGGRWPELEERLIGRVPLEGARLRGAILHATIGRKGDAWPELDRAAVTGGPVSCAMVAAAVHGKRDLDFEVTIEESIGKSGRSPGFKEGFWSAITYAKGVGLRDWPDIESALMERAMSGDPAPIVKWALEVMRGPIPGLGGLLAGHDRLAASYAEVGRPNFWDELAARGSR